MMPLRLIHPLLLPDICFFLFFSNFLTYMFLMMPCYWSTFVFSLSSAGGDLPYRCYLRGTPIATEVECVR